MRRKRQRRIRYRPGSRRGLRLARLALGAVAAVALGLALQTGVRSLQTARLNRSLQALHTVESGAAPSVEVAAPAIEARADGQPAMRLSRMGMPDGTPIVAASDVPDAPADFHDTLSDLLPDMLKLIRGNPDTVGWLYIKGIVALPVVYRDNSYYLNHDFYGHHSSAGTLFLDENHPLTARAQHLLIHGHSMNDGSMFGLLTHYQKAETLKAHPLIAFSTLWEKEKYAVFAVLRVSSRPGDARYFDYSSHPAFASDAAMTDYVRALRARSLFDIPVDVRPDDALLTLSTCLDDDRLVIVARKLRPGETEDEAIAAVQA